MLESIFKFLTRMTDEEFQAYTHPPTFDDDTLYDVDEDVAREEAHQKQRKKEAEELEAWENCQWYYDHHYHK